MGSSTSKREIDAKTLDFLINDYTKIRTKAFQASDLYDLNQSNEGGAIEEEFKKPYMESLRSFLIQEKSRGARIFPPPDQIFAAINETSLDDTKVVIIGQDPYHKVNQAHGLSFSVNPEIKIPPSLVNIFKELKDDLGCEAPNHGFLKSWANQGVLLLNSILSVEEGKPGSHDNKGWEVFTDKLIEVLNLVLNL
mgnify:CR=1 FL=1